MSAPATFIRSCPRCGGRILWCDGLPSPELSIVDGRVAGCGACFVRIRQKATTAPAPSRPSTASTTDTRTVREKLTQEGKVVVDILYAGLDVADGIRNLWRKINGK